MQISASEAGLLEGSCQGFEGFTATYMALHAELFHSASNSTERLVWMCSSDLLNSNIKFRYEAYNHFESLLCFCVFIG